MLPVLRGKAASGYSRTNRLPDVYVFKEEEIKRIAIKYSFDRKIMNNFLW